MLRKARGPRDALRGVRRGLKEEKLPNHGFRGLTFIGAVLLAAAASTSASAQSTVETDAQCLVLTNRASREAQNPKAQQALFAAHFYYLARVHSEVSNDRLGTVLLQAAKSIVPGLAGKTFESCGAAVQTAESDVVQAGKMIQAQAK